MPRGREWDNRGMHPKVLLDACAELVRLTLTFEHPADAVVSRFFRDHRGLGPRERATLAETVYTVLRKKLLFDHLAPSGSGPKERRLAILGFYGPRDFLKSALNEQEKSWLDQCDAVPAADLLEPHRHNLPEWLVQPLKRQVGDGFWALAESLAATVRFEALPGKTFTGHITFVAGATNDAAPPTLTRSIATPEPLGQPVRVPVRIKLDQPDPALRPGMSAYVRIAVR